MPQLLQRRNGYDDDIIIITDLTECFHFFLLPLFQLQLIFSGEYTKAMSKDWHLGHFSCWQCDESLTGQRYVLRDEHQCIASSATRPCSPTAATTATGQCSCLAPSCSHCAACRCRRSVRDPPTLSYPLHTVINQSSIIHR